jgi:quercetin dioxygenase-like cupin family protein
VSIELDPINAPTEFRISSLKEEILAALESDEGFGDGQRIEGRAVAVKASPRRGNAQQIVVGTAALPPGYRTPPHRHASEEVALVLSGSGRIDIDGALHRVEEGSVVVTPGNSQHSTLADRKAPLVILWFYAPPGSEERWLPHG